MNLTRTSFVRSVAAAFLCSAAPFMAVAEAVTIQHAKGETTLEAVPQKVAVFDLASLDVLDALGVTAVAGVPKVEDGSVNFPEYLQAYGAAEYAGIGTLFEPDIDALTELQPDLIIIAGRSASQYDAVSQIAPTMDLSPQADGLVDSAKQLTNTLATIFDLQEAGDERMAALDEAVAAMHQAADADDDALVLFAVANNMMAHAPGARFGTIYDYIGLPSVMDPAEPGAGGPRPEPGSPEAEAARQRQQEARDAALAADPDWIITLNRGAISGDESDLAERLAADQAIAATTALQQGQVIHLDPHAWYLVGHGIQNLTDTAVTIAERFSTAAE